MSNYTACNGTGRVISHKQRKIVWSYQSVDGKQHQSVNCPACTKELKCGNTDFVPRHKRLPS